MSLVVRELEVLTQEIEDKEPNLYQPGQSIRALQSWRALGEYHVEKMTIFELLCELEQMCEDSSVKSVNDMNRNAYNRLMDIFKQLTVRSDTPTRNLVEQYKRILLEFRASLMRSAAAGSSEIAQFAASRQGAENNFLIHGRIDRFVTAACLSNTTGNPDWREQWESQRVQQQHEFMKKLDVDSMASLLEDIADEKERDDAQTLVSFELSKNAKTCATYLSTSFTGAKSTLSALATMKDVDWFIPEYEVEFDAFHEFSSGAFGSVHHGKWKHAEVVVKKVKLGSSSDAAAFVNEVKIWHKLRHPYVIQLFGACHTKQPFFVCEFAPNGQLDHYLKTNGGDVWKKLYEAALGLQYLHWMGVIHGDLKCNNILVGGDGATKLADFGLSSLSSSIILIEPESEIDSGDKPRPVGAIRWKAPEMLKGEKGTLASDVYSFGMCIIEAVSGEYPWGMRLPDVAVKYHVLHKTLPKRPAMIDGDAWSLVEQMCRYAPEDRMGIRQVVEALQNKC
ncbi:hypothetical protein PHYBOEH_005712 [Phytophthora boehmeriae]|uniref:Protein kinase domain-containing protein n=1 Tax=Phytophthora boehmeriae TaxID=109152 RepID=A0A8T1XET1_9STRA|nr:hypothetical protein PHYBOEH_005712 [Phytophthora boehmeriae]